MSHEIRPIHHFATAALLFVVGACKHTPDAPGPKDPLHDSSGPGGTPTGKGSPLAVALSEIAPGYRVKAPAGSETHLGHRLVRRQPETNACFRGKDAVAPTGGWDRIETEYDMSASGGLKLDFGSILQIPVSAGTSVGGSKKVGLVLTKLREHSLENVFFTADSGCADDFEAVERKTYPVITRAIKAESVEITGAKELVSSANVEVGKIGGAEVSTSKADTRRWEGTNLFFADFPECLDVRVQKQTCEGKAIGPGNVCDLGTCSFQVEAVETRTSAETQKSEKWWKGNLSCEGGSSTNFEGLLGRFAGAKEVAAGVSYNMRVLNGPGDNSVNIELRRWTVKTADESCPG